MGLTIRINFLFVECFIIYGFLHSVGHRHKNVTKSSNVYVIEHDSIKTVKNI